MDKPTDRQSNHPILAALGCTGHTTMPCIIDIDVGILSLGQQGVGHSPLTRWSYTCIRSCACNGHQMIGWEGFSKHIECKHHIQECIIKAKNATCFCMWTCQFWTFFLFVASKWLSVGNFVASQNCCSYQFTDERGEGEYYGCCSMHRRKEDEIKLRFSTLAYYGTCASILWTAGWYHYTYMLGLGPCKFFDCYPATRSL